MAVRRKIVTGTGLLGIPSRLTPEETEEVPGAIIKFLTTLSDQIIALYTKVNGGLSLGDGGQSTGAGNLNAQWIEWKFSATPDSVEAIPHGLGRIPVGYMVMRRDRAAIVYDANTGGWGETMLYLSCDTASALVKLLVW